MKKIISLFLSLTMLLSLTAGLDFSAYADTLTSAAKMLHIPLTAKPAL